MIPRVSVVVPTYNRAHVLARAVNSILAQTFQDFEVIIIDDYSKDNTTEIIRAFNDPRIRFVRHERNKGGSAARNTGIRLAQGELIAFLDSDDQWLPPKLEKQLSLFIRDEVGFVYCGLIFMDSRGKENGQWFVPCGQDFRNDLLVSNFIGTTSTIVVRSELLKRIGGFDESLRSCQDWDLYLRLRKLCEFAYVEEFLVRYETDRFAKNRISTNPEAVLSGQGEIQRKFSEEIAALPRAKKIARTDYLLMISMGVAHLRGVAIAREAFALSGQVKYLFMMVKIVVKCLLLKLRLRRNLT